MSRLSFALSLAAVAYISAAAAAFTLDTIKDSSAEPHAIEAICESDEDCMRHCPPPADDPDCDGGPDDVTAARGDYGTQP